ncbi:hypothetical protein G9A89_016943 [Geosiphon pyriformis]|nr:hypothetical protein G9A89_016943 [Geosiphon pyriformis]
MAIRPDLNNQIMAKLNTVEAAQITQIYFVGHAIGGAYAVIAGLTWKLEQLFLSKHLDPPRLNKTNLLKLSVSVFTYGQPRVGNLPFSRLVNTYLNVWRFTYDNEPVPHYPLIENGRHFMQHHETEYWIKPPECDCSKEQTKYFECPGYSRLSAKYKPSDNIDPLSFENIGSEWGENQECNAGQSISEFDEDFKHQGPYFGVTMGVCWEDFSQVNPT